MQQLVIQFGSELKRPVINLKPVFQSSDEMDRLLTLNLIIQHGIGHAVDCRRITQLLVERSLIIQAGGETETEVLIKRRDDAQGDTR